MAERYNCTLLSRLKPNLQDSPFHWQFWSDALEYAVWTTNQSPTRTNIGFKTPIEVYTGQPPSMRHAQVFGTLGHYLVPTADRRKLDSNTRACYFLGVLPNGDGVKVVDSTSKKIVKTCDYFFPWNPVTMNPSSGQSPQSKTEIDESPWDFPHEGAHHPIIPEEHHDNADDEVEGQRLPHPDEHPPDNQPPSRPSCTRHVPSCYGNLVAQTASLDVSPTYKMAINSPEKARWREAMQTEINSLIKRKVFTLVPRPSNAKIISCRWHLKKKLNLDGTLKKFKACLVARGFTQREGIDYQETFAPSSRQESLKAFLAVSGHLDWEVIQLDVVGAFLYGELKETIYLSQPEGFVDKDHPTHVWKLNLSLYGLKQSARQWYQCLGDQLRTMGFQTTTVDPSLNVLKKEE